MEKWNNIYSTFDPIAFNLFGIPVHWYGIMYVLALLVALFVAKWIAKKDSYPILPIFKLIQKTGNIPERDMYNTFNMGIGMAVIVKKEEVQKAIEIIEQQGEKAYIIGEVIQGQKDIEM